MADTIYPGDAQPSDVLATKKYSAGTNYNVPGTMPNNGQKIITPSAAQQTIPQGYHDGTGYVQGVSVPAANVLTGTTIAGTAGTMPNNGALGTITPGTAAHPIPAGYTSGGTVAGDPNLVAGNILAGVSIFGVSGNVTARKYATGTATSGTTGGNSNNITGGALTTYPLTVTGLAFQPVLIVWRKTSGNVPRFQYNVNDTGLGNYPVLYMPVANQGYQNQLPSGYGVTSNGFTMPADSSNTQFVWEAYA